MKTETIALYHTRLGLVAFEVKRYTSTQGHVSYSYMGKHGAGSGFRDLDHIKRMIALTMETKRGIKLVSGGL